MKMVKCLPEFEYFTVFLKKRNFISKIKRSKVTDYAALRETAKSNAKIIPNVITYNPSLPRIGEIMNKYWGLLALSKKNLVLIMSSNISLYWHLKDHKTLLTF